MNNERPGDASLLRITALRIVKDKPGFYGMPDMQWSADFYCAPLQEPKYFYETEDEFVLYVEHLRLTDACLVTGSFAADDRWAPAAILCEGRRLFWRQEQGRICFNFEISGLTGRTRTLYVHTLLREPGLTVRIEQNAEGRRAGPYRQEPYPAVQIDAASHYIFAVRRVLKKLDVPGHLSREELGYVLLLSFETSNEVHGDWPPHWHMLLRWPDHCGSQAPHIYLDEQGRMTHNVMYIDMIPNVTYTYQPGQWCPFQDKYGREVFRCRIEQDGGISLTREGRALYTVGAYTPEGVAVAEDGRGLGTLRVENDTRQGVMQVFWAGEGGGEKTLTVRYDPLTGETQEYTAE